jgi:Putative beta barrel porin-7 (BBP7)
MKITKMLLVMALAGSCLQQASAQNVSHSTSTRPASRHVGDGVRSLGDTNRTVEMTEDIRPESFRPKAKFVSNSEMIDMSVIAPTVSESCDGSGDCYTGCDSGASLTRSCSGQTEYWLSMESLLWFGQKRQTPPLITTAPQGVLPTLPGATTVFGGGDGIDSGILPGYSLSGGKYLDCCQKYGVGGRVFGIFQNTQSRTLASQDGSTSIGIPLFNLGGLPIANQGTGVEDAFLVAYRDQNNTLVSHGTVTARADLNMIGAEASGYMLLGRSSDHRVDLVSGYTYNKLKDSVTVTSSVTDDFTGNLIPNGTVFNTNDLFETNNQFHGAHIGLLSSVVHKRITLSTLAKVSFGNMSETVGIRGFLTREFNGSTTFPGGIFAQPSNIGEYTRNRFAFLPEMRVKMGYALSDCLQLTTGYSFMYWSSVALAGNQMDRTIDFSQGLAGPAATRPAFSFVESGYWMHGVDLGLTMTY